MNSTLPILQSISECRICEPFLEAGVRPVFQIDPESKILIAGQAPGLKVHQSGIPFDDASGDRLRSWLGMDRETFYDPKTVAIVPMGFCYPGKGKSGDLPPRKECVQTWHDDVMKVFSNLKLTLVIGKYAIDYHFREQIQKQGRVTLTEMVKNWKSSPKKIPLPHPSPRNNIWLRKNSWFEETVIPSIKRKVRSAIRK